MALLIMSIVEALSTYTVPREKSDYLIPGAPTPQVQPNFDMSVDPTLLDLPSPRQSESQPSNLVMQSNLRLFPPPLFSRQTIPQGYKLVGSDFGIIQSLTPSGIGLSFKGNSASMVSSTVDEETGEERKRLINRMRWKGYGPAAIMFSDAIVRSCCIRLEPAAQLFTFQVPDKPPQTVEDARAQADKKLLIKLQAVMDWACIAYRAC